MIVVIKASRLIMTITESQKSDMEGDKLSQVSFLKEGGGGGREREREREREILKIKIIYLSSQI
jgi:hypothetical protein